MIMQIEWISVTGDKKFTIFGSPIWNKVKGDDEPCIDAAVDFVEVDKACAGGQ